MPTFSNLLQLLLLLLPPLPTLTNKCCNTTTTFLGNATYTDLQQRQLQDLRFAWQQVARERLPEKGMHQPIGTFSSPQICVNFSNLGAVCYLDSRKRIRNSDKKSCSGLSDLQVSCINVCTTVYFQAPSLISSTLAHFLAQPAVSPHLTQLQC